MSQGLAANPRYTLQHKYNKDFCYDGIAVGVPRIGDHMVIENKKYTVIDIIWEWAEVFGDLGCAAWGYFETDLGHVTIVVENYDDGHGSLG